MKPKNRTVIDYTAIPISAEGARNKNLQKLVDTYDTDDFTGLIWKGHRFVSKQ